MENIIKELKKLESKENCIIYELKIKKKYLELLLNEITELEQKLDVIRIEQEEEQELEE